MTWDDVLVNNELIAHNATIGRLDITNVGPALIYPQQPPTTVSALIQDMVVSPDSTVNVKFQDAISGKETFVIGTLVTESFNSSLDFAFFNITQPSLVDHLDNSPGLRTQYILFSLDDKQTWSLPSEASKYTIFNRTTYQTMIDITPTNVPFNGAIKFDSQYPLPRATVGKTNQAMCRLVTEVTNDAFDVPFTYLDANKGICYLNGFENKLGPYNLTLTFNDAAFIGLHFPPNLLEVYNATINPVDIQLFPVNSGFTLTISGEGFPARQQISVVANTTASLNAPIVSNINTYSDTLLRLDFNPINITFNPTDQQAQVEVFISFNAGSNFHRVIVFIHPIPNFISMLPSVALLHTPLSPIRFNVSGNLPSSAIKGGQAYCIFTNSSNGMTTHTKPIDLTPDDSFAFCGSPNEKYPGATYENLLTVYLTMNNDKNRFKIGDLLLTNILLTNVTTPRAGPKSGGTVITFTGSRFNNSRFDIQVGLNTSSTYRYVAANLISDTMITVTTPPSTAGPTAPIGTEPFLFQVNGFDSVDTKEIGLEYAYVDLPQMNLVTASFGNMFVSTPVRFSLANFPVLTNLAGEVTCRFGNITVLAQFTAGNNQNFTCPSPAFPDHPYAAWESVPLDLSVNGQQFVSTNVNYTFTHSVLTGAAPSLVDKRGGSTIVVNVTGIPSEFPTNQIKVQLGELNGQYTQELSATLNAAKTMFSFVLPPLPFTINNDETKTLGISISLNDGLSYGANDTSIQVHDTFVVQTSFNPSAMPIDNVVEVQFFTSPSAPNVGTPTVRYTTQFNGTFLLPARHVTSSTYAFTPPTLPVAQNATVELSLNGIEWSNHQSNPPLHYRFSINPDGFHPINAPNTTTGQLTIQGDNFVVHPGMQPRCFFDGVQTSMVVLNPTTIACNYPQSSDNTTQQVLVSMSNPVVRTNTSVLFPRPLQPLITAFWPMDIPFMVRQDITIVGVNFVSGPEMRIAFSPDSQFPGSKPQQFISATKVVMKTPEFTLGSGPKDLFVSTNDGVNKFQALNGQKLNLRNPMLNAIDTGKVFGLVTGGTNITLTGDYFLPSSYGFFIKLVVQGHNGRPPAVHYLNETLNGESNVTIANDKKASFIQPPFVVNPPLPQPEGSIEVEVLVSTNGGQSYSNQVHFDIVLEPVLQTPLPASVDVTRNTLIKVQGGPMVNRQPTMIRLTVPSTNNATFIKPNFAQGKFEFNMPNLVITGQSETIEMALTLNGQQYQTTQLLGYISPSVATIDFKSGPSLGQTNLVITGSNFTNTGTIRARFGSNLFTSPLVNVNFVSSTRLTVVTPALSNGIQLPHEVTLKITQNNDVSELSTDDVKFNYYNPTSEYQYTISPGNGPDEGGTTLDIIKKPGTPAFVDTQEATIKFKNATLDITQTASFINADLLRVNAPSILPSTRQFTDFQLLLALNGQQFSKLTDNPPVFTYHAPVIVNTITPEVSPVSGGTTLQLSCNNTLTGGVLRVKFKDTASTAQRIVTDCTFASPGVIRCTAPSFAGETGITLPMTVRVSVSLNGVQYSKSSQNITVFATPAIAQLSPQNSPESGGAQITISGTNMVTDSIKGVIAKARFGSGTGANVVDLIVLDSTTAVATVPSGSSGQAPVEIAFDGETFTTNGRTITYYKNPTLSSVTPIGGQFNASTPITITGSGFPDTGAELMIRLTDGNGISANTTGTRINQGQITFAAPVIKDTVLPRQFDVQVAPNGLQFVGGTNIRVLYYDIAELASLDVRSGPDSGQTWITISGRNFVNMSSTIVSFSSQIFVTNNRVSGEFLSVSSIRCQSPPINPGIVLPHEVDVTLSLNGLVQQNVPSTLKFKIYDTTNSDSFSISPNAGLDTGATNLMLQSVGAPFVDTKQIRMQFIKPGVGGVVITVPATFMTSTTISVVTPNVSQHVDKSFEAWDTKLALNGQQFTVNGEKFTFYRQPTLKSVTPNAAQIQLPGPQPGLDVKLDIEASGLYPQAQIGLKFDPQGPGTPVTMQGCIFRPPNRTECTLSPPQTAGPQQMLLSLNGQQFTPVGLPFNFYPLSGANTILPRSGPVQGGTSISIGGTGFQDLPQAKVRLTGFQGQGVNNNIEFPLTVVNPTLAGFVIDKPFNLSGTLPDLDITMSFNGQQFAASVLKFALFNAIQVNQVNPVAIATGGQSITITGQFHTSNLAVYRVRFMTLKDDQSLVVETVNVPQNALGQTRIVVASPAFNGITRPMTVGISVSANDQQYVVANNNITIFDPPTVTGFNTTKAIVQGGTPILVEGTGFIDTGIATIFLSPKAGQTPQLTLTAPLTYLSPTKMEFTAPVLQAVSYLFDPFIRLGGTAAGQATLATSIEFVTERRINSRTPHLVPASTPASTTFEVRGIQIVPVANGELCFFDIAGNTVSSVMTENAGGTAALCPFPDVDYAGLGLLDKLPITAQLDVSSKLGVGVSGVSVPILIVPEPIVTRLEPPTGPAAGLYSVFVIGSQFINTTLIRCRFDNTVVPGTYHNSTTIECQAPAHFEGTVPFAVSLNAQKFHAITGAASTFVYEGCAPGTFSTAFTTPCALCPGGTFKGTVGGLSECNECPENSYCPAGSQQAIACPANSVALKGSRDASNCQCSPNFYTPAKQPGTACVACPEGASCAGQTNVPIAKPGFWASAVTGEFTFFECSVPSACPGGSATTSAATGCATGYAGRMCSACSKRYYRLEKLCEPCPETGGLMIIIASICFVLFLMGLRKFGTAKGGSLAISLTHLQIVAMYADFKLPWPEIVLEFLSILSIVNLNMDLTAPECTFAEWSYENKFYLTMALPLAVGIGLSILLALQHLVSQLRTLWESSRGRKFSRNPDDDLPKPEKIGDKIMVGLLSAQPVNQMVLRTTANSFLSICSLMYLIVTNKALEVLDCTQLSDTVSVLDAYGEMDCWSDRHWALVYPAVFFIIVYVIGIPVTYCVILYKNRRKLHNEVIKKTYGAVFDKYRLDTFWFEPIVMARKIMIVFAKLFFTRVPLLQGLASMYIFIGSMMLQLIFKPFATRIQNIQEAMFLTFNLLLLLSGLSFMSSAYDDIENVRGMVALITIGLIVVMLVLAVLFVVRDLKQSLTHITEAIRGRKHKSLAYLDTHFHEEASDDDVVDAIRSYGKQYLTEDAYDSLVYHVRNTFSREDLRIVASYFASLRAFDKNVTRIPFFNNPLDGMNSERTRAVTLAWIDSNDQDKQGFLDLMALLQYRKVRFQFMSRQVKSKLTFGQQQQMMIRKMEDHHNVNVVQQSSKRQQEKLQHIEHAKSLIEEEEAMGVDWDEDENGNPIKVFKSDNKATRRGPSADVIEMDSLERGETLDAKAIANRHKTTPGDDADENDEGEIELPGAVSAKKTEK
eukprot:TRINITY_DN417_c0_g4_i1.p1 TRINITY_DN417_c0_g4~~TRINITY_DN417_c0_g4_i1.p1  ORF type:complete len:3914 (-),score=1148.76 TRINITY_DN417_c0_g4_i1:1146-11180(-)